MSDRPTPSPILQLQDVSLTTAVSASYLLQDLSFKVFKGDRIAIVGPSGAGKTSLLRLLNRLHDPTSGAISFNNQPLTQIPIISLRQQIVLVPQEPKLLGMSVKETLVYPLVLQRLSKSEIQQRVETGCSQLHIANDWLERNELQLSLGQRQLVAIARGLIMRSPLLLLDEPTSALDAGSANHLIETLIQLASNTQTTILMVNHQLDLVQQFANRVLYLQQGQLLNDLLAAQLDWVKLRDNLVQAEADKILNSEF